MAFIDT